MKGFPRHLSIDCNLNFSDVIDWILVNALKPRESRHGATQSFKTDGYTYAATG